MGQYVQQDIDKAIYYFTLAANKGHIKAQYELSLLYYIEGGTIKDINKSIYYCTLAANKNYANAQYTLGIIYWSFKRYK